MKLTLLAVALLVPTLAFAQPRGAIVTDQIEAVVTVTKVDQKARTVTVRGPRGNLQTLAVPPDSQNLDQVKPGDRFKITYAEAAVIAITQGGQPTQTVDEVVQLAPKGAKPGGFQVRTYQISGVVDAIDYKSRYVAVRGPKGNILALPVNDSVKDLDKLKVGDKMQGVEQFGDFAIQIRMKMMTKPGEQFVIRRKAFAMIQKAFDANGIKFAFPTVQVAGGPPEATAVAAARQGLDLSASPLKK